jgi:hypothetical protein
VSSTYEFHVGGPLEGHWSIALGVQDLRHHPDGTSALTVEIADQAHLHGVLAMIRDIGAPLLSLRALPSTLPADARGPVEGAQGLPG